MPLRAHQLRTPEEIARYISFGDQVYAGNAYWVPSDRHHMTSLLSGQKEAGPHWTVQPFWVEQDSGILCTLTAVVDDLYNQHWKECAGHLLFFQALSGCEEAAEMLFAEACAWLRAQRCSFARASFLYGWELPWTIDAYDEVPTLFHTYNPPHYHRYAKNAGFHTEKGVVQYQVGFTPELAEGYRAMIARAATHNVRLRCWDFARLDQEIASFASLLNETFAGHWGSPQFTQSQMQGFIGGMKDLLVPDFLGFAELDGETVGFVVSFPDLNQALHPMRGKNIEEHLPEFQRRLEAIDHGILLIIGVQERARGRGVSLALAAQSYLAMMKRGYKSASYTVVLDDNWPSRRTAEKLGARVTRNFVIYRKELTP
jgi:GNAT superfamily N-acetyltransferase